MDLTEKLNLVGYAEGERKQLKCTFKTFLRNKKSAIPLRDDTVEYLSHSCHTYYSLALLKYR